MNFGVDTDVGIELRKETSRRIPFVPPHLVTQCILLLERLWPRIRSRVRNASPGLVFDHPLAVLPAEHGLRQVLQLKDRRQRLRDDHEIDLVFTRVEIGEN